MKEHKDLDITDVYNDLEDIDDTLELDDDTIVDSEEEYTEAGSEPVEEEYEDEEYEEETGIEPVVDDGEDTEVEEAPNNKKPIIPSAATTATEIPIIIPFFDPFFRFSPYTIKL